jgi:hypothetical protein
MYYKDIHQYKDAQFQRLIGVKRVLFEEMVSVVTNYKQKQKKHPCRGRPSRLCIADQVLVMLMYYREYRTFFHVGSSYGISEAQCWRIVTTVESILIEAGLFHLPGKKQLIGDKITYEVVIVDVSESPVERPKKNSEGIIRAKRKGIL